MNHLEKLIRQFYEWQGYIVPWSVRGEQLPKGGWAGELDIGAKVAHPSRIVTFQTAEVMVSEAIWAELSSRFDRLRGRKA
jgi:hypothetical protein